MITNIAYPQQLFRISIQDFVPSLFMYLSFLNNQYHMDYTTKFHWQLNIEYGLLGAQLHCPLCANAEETLSWAAFFLSREIFSTSPVQAFSFQVSVQVDKLSTGLGLTLWVLLSLCSFSTVLNFHTWLSLPSFIVFHILFLLLTVDLSKIRSHTIAQMSSCLKITPSNKLTHYFFIQPHSSSQDRSSMELDSLPEYNVNYF